MTDISQEAVETLKKKLTFETVNGEIDRDFAGELGRIICALRDEVDRLEATRGVKVKPLEWEKGIMEVARTPLGGKYLLAWEHWSKTWSWCFDDGNRKFHRGLSKPEAKEAVQADYESKVRSILEPDHSDWNAVLEAARKLLELHDDIMSDIQSAHSNRGNGASEWMREDDREFRNELRSIFDTLESALKRCTHPKRQRCKKCGGSVSKSFQTGVLKCDQCNHGFICTHPNIEASIEGYHSCPECDERLEDPVKSSTA